MNEGGFVAAKMVMDRDGFELLMAAKANFPDGSEVQEAATLALGSLHKNGLVMTTKPGVQRDVRGCPIIKGKAFAHVMVY